MAPPHALVLLLLAAAAAAAAGDGCLNAGCVALGSYLISRNQNLTYIASLFGIDNYKTLAPYNPGTTNMDYIVAGQSVNISFPCGCHTFPNSDATYLGGSFPHRVVTGDTYGSIAQNYNNLTSEAWLERTNPFPANNIPDTNTTVNVMVNCTCGDRDISPDYGFFLTYPLMGQNLSAVAANYSFNSPSQLELLRKYNPGMDTATSGLVFIPVQDRNGSYHPLNTPGRRKANKAALLPSSEDSIQLATTSMDKSTLLTSQADNASGVPGITVDKSVEFSYEELFNATEGFSMSNKIGQGGFGAVYYAELRGEKAAIKKMDMQASHEFLAELKVLTHVHHLNLVRLIGFCTESSLFLVYEFIENGNLSQHLRGTGYEPLSWAARVQIALDSARGLEYIHEHTVPVYIHRDIKSANILIDKNYRAKVADFGLTKLTQVGNTSLPTRGIVGTFGYMPPEYARYGDVSPKVDVYAFGVVLYELISAKDAIVRSTESSSDSKGLVYLFEEALNTPNPKEGLERLIDPALGKDYPIDSILKMTVLARACTQEDPKARPTMRSIVVALMTLSSTSEFWDMNAIQENQGLVNLMSGR
ncbi:unnamed protein product [Miscanthus lutarioriparius]|uniref:non-specific serine/threonine protein kinase n=1 Tax=Miscanthus lutarioriparius TaxID=422564 RepID=A0A811R497_9POAL|nr:unnamed protein product [Miscanthus lutarioriparius]